MRFRFRPVPFVATLLLVALGIALGRWQDGRALEKAQRQAMLAERGQAAQLVPDAARVRPETAEYRRVRATGTWVPQWAIYLDNRPLQGRAGFYVLMPLRLAGSDMHVLVARGWLPRDPARRDRIAPYPTPAGQVTVEGIALASMGRVMQLGEPPSIRPGAILQNLGPDAFALASGFKVQPFFVQQECGADDALVRDWPQPSLGIDKHKGYAFQWYALAAMALAFFVITGFRSGKHRTEG